MSLHFNCPNNDTIYCNRGYELGEFYRQVNLIIGFGKYVPINDDGDSKCQVPNAQLCPMCQNAILHTAQQQRINTGK